MNKIIPIILLVLTSQIAQADYDRGTIALPEYIALEYTLARDLKELNDPDEDPKLVSVLIPIYKMRVALFNLISGKIARFHDAALSLPEMSLPENIPELNDSSYLSGGVAELLHLSVEADILISDPKLIEFFGSAIDHLNSNTNISDEQRALYRASYYSLIGDADKLSKVALTANTFSSTMDGYFVCGYANLLAGYLTGNVEQLTQSVSCLERISPDFDEIAAFGEKPRLGAAVRNTETMSTHRLAVGRAALHRANALKLLAEGETSYEAKRRYIQSAARAITQARTNIDLMDNPLMWGAAYKVTSEILDVLYSVESADTSRAAGIAQRRDRAFQLSIAYR